MKEIELKDEIILTVKKAINDFSDIDVDLDYVQTSAAEIDLMANQVADTLIGQGWGKLSPSGSQKIFKDGYLKGFRDGQQEFGIIKQRNFELITKTERMTEEKAALENDALNNEMNLKTLTAENKRLKAQINDLKSTKNGLIVAPGKSRRHERGEKMKAKYCKTWRCPEHKEEPCALADDCWLFEWDIDRLKVKTPKAAITPLEEDEQREFAAWLDKKGVLWAHIPNERKASLAVLSSLARQGLKKGFPDNFIAVARGAWHGLFIELKRAKKNLSVRSKEQREWIKALNEAGYKAMFCYGAEEAKKAVIEYLEENKNDD